MGTRRRRSGRVSVPGSYGYLGFWVAGSSDLGEALSFQMFLVRWDLTLALVNEANKACSANPFIYLFV